MNLARQFTSLDVSRENSKIQSPPMKVTKFFICAISIAAALAAAKSYGQNLTATLITIAPGLPVNGTLDNGNFVQDYPSGVLQFGDFEAFCVEPFEDLFYGETLVYSIQGVGLLPNSDQISRLVGGFLASSRSDQEAAAAQWAIWEITTENLLPPSLSDGNVRISTPVSAATATLGNQYLANINTFAPASLTYLTNVGGQDVVTWNVIPEPTSFALVALSSGFLLRRRR
jgi:hypothetical protein